MVRKWGVGLIALLTGALPACGGDDDRQGRLLSGVTAISAGDLYTCALVKDGTVNCWGATGWGTDPNTEADDTSHDAWAAATVPGVVDATGVSAGDLHACAVSSDGSVRCWGRAFTSSRPSPPLLLGPALLADGVADAAAVAAGTDHNCALLRDGTVQCWGKDSSGALGNGSLPTGAIASVMPPSAVVDVNDATAIAVGRGRSCALHADGGVQCWGDTWVDGEPETNDAGARRFYLDSAFTPRVVEGLAPATSIAIGDSFTCAALADTTVACWGLNHFLDLGANASPATPVAISGLTDVTAISAGLFHACALSADRTVRCWGSNLGGRLGDGSEMSSTVPVLVKGIDTAVAISAGAIHTCALLLDSTVHCWGSRAGGCGRDTCKSSSIPLPVRVVP